jgi:phytol kinase
MIHPLGINMWLGMAIELAMLAILMGGLSLYQGWRSLSPEMSRRLFHIGGGLTTLTFPWVFAEAWPVVLLALITVPSLLALKYIRIFKGNLGSVLYRIDRKSFGEVYFPLSVCLLFVFAHSDALLFIIPVLILTLADPVAAVIGSRYGRLRYVTIKGQKSVEGSAAFFLVAFPCVLIPLLLFTAMSLVEAVLIATIVGLLVMMAEAVAWEGLDNLFIPVVGFFLLAILLHLDRQILLLQLVATLCLLIAACWRCRRVVAK